MGWEEGATGVAALAAVVEMGVAARVVGKGREGAGWAGEGLQRGRK